MTHPNLKTNGASLEDCHTNFFALTELSGIKWRKLVWPEGNGTGLPGGSVGEPLEDPVLRSYARCLAADILCVWRRVSTTRATDMFELGPPPPAPPPPLSLNASKELWIFWYGEEPDLNELVAPELNSSDSEQGSWESGLSYKCRSLLFKALHNLIERCLLSRDFIRLGKWFVQPYEGSKKISSEISHHLSFSFAFFVHGESSVCASVDVRQHPPVRRLNRNHLQQALSSTSGLKVILAPFGLSGVLTGQCYKTTDASNRLLEEWGQFYPVDKSTSLTESSVVEVIVGGVKMRYPSCYVLITDLDDNANTLNGPPNFTNNVGPANKPDFGNPITEETPPPSPVYLNSKVPQPGPYSVSIEHLSNMWKDQTAANILPERAWQECIHNGPSTSHQPQQDGNWDFVDPTKKITCSCYRCTTQSGGESYTPQGGPPSYPRTQESMAIPSVGTPPSVTPSPLPNPNSQQPTSVPPTDSTMPTLSPHAGSTIRPSPSNPTEGVGGEANKSFTPERGGEGNNNVKIESTGNSPMPTENNTKGGVDGGNSQNKGVLKRPLLLSKEYEVALGEEEQTLEMLYDYSTMDAWLNHPVKRFKANQIQQPEHQNTTYDKYDLYSMFENKLESDLVNRNQSNFVGQEIKQENESEQDSSQTAPLGHGVKRPGDPYEFDEEGANNSTYSLDGFKREPGLKEEPKDSKKITSGNLFQTEMGLHVSGRPDLDQIFDNSDTSSDEAMNIQTPPGSTTMLHEEKRLSGHGFPNMGIVRPEELSKMFPTPPSLEHNPIASPCAQLDLPPPDFSDLGGIIRVKQEIYPNMGSPQEELIDDWSYVFKPQTINKMVGSSKYAPLTNLPSQNAPTLPIPQHCTYKPSWVQHAEKTLSQTSTTTNTTPSTQNQNSVSTGSAITQMGGATSGPNLATPLLNSPMPIGGQFRPPPPPYELPSPATSTGSSYLNKNINSVEQVRTNSPNLVTPRTPEGSALILNILLTDTAFNIFRDHNFDSCTLCVCNGTGNIRGADAGVYLVSDHAHQAHAQVAVGGANSPFPGMQGLGGGYGMLSPQGGVLGDEDSLRCSCGFSAVVNRKLATGSGMFYEDEKEITGITEDPGEKKKASLLSFLISTNVVKMDASIDREQIDVLPHSLLELIREQCVFIPSNVNALCRAADFSRLQQSQTKDVHSNEINVLEYRDSNEVTIIALDQSRQVIGDPLGMCKLEDQKNRQGHNMSVHKWPYLKACGPQCNQDIVRIMKLLQPLLQDAIQKKCQTRLWEAPSAVKGPLTWRQFHRLAGRGTDDRCEPQPIPSVVVGHDKDWLALSPYALHLWESLLLEPYSYARDVAYIVVSPDNDAILPRVRTFFKELSTTYEMCKLGRHSPITKVLRDGILRVGKTAKSKIGNESVEEWFSLLGEGETTDMLKLYAQVCKHHLAPHLTQVPLDKTLLDPPQDSSEIPIIPSPMPPPSTPDSMQAPTLEKTIPVKIEPAETIKESTSSITNLPETCHDEDEREAPCIVVYLVEPFSFGSDQPELQRLACLALLRCFQSIMVAVPENIRNNLSVQIISLESIVELGKARDRNKQSDHMRALSLNIFSQCRRLLTHSNNVKSLTGFGTAAMADLFLKSKDEKNRAPYKLYTPPYILAPMREKVEAVESFGKGSADQASVLYLSYCLSEDQSWLLAVATDERGEIFETITINIDIPNRSRRKKASARRIGLDKLMNFILEVMSQSSRPWRLVVGRLGRIGHGELKGWSWLLSRKYLLKASRHLKEICKQCSLMYPSSVPCILSACLVSLEPDSALRLMPDQFTPDERFSAMSVNSQLSTPQDVSCTHILVFPTSATTQSSQTAFQEQHITPELMDDDIFTVGLDDDMPEGIDGMNDLCDIFNWTESGPGGGGPSPSGSPRREDTNPGSPGCPNQMRQGSPFQMGQTNAKNQDSNEEVGLLLQQPLALGYLVSTAPTGRMPRWFWSACPHLEDTCPAFLKNALHLHSPNVQQSSDELFQQSAVTSHPLDSQYTTDVLRYVLEGYNALSWLALDSNTRDRLSCLPVHMQVLIQLYHTTAALL